MMFPVASVKQYRGWMWPIQVNRCWPLRVKIGREEVTYHPIPLSTSFWKAAHRWLLLRGAVGAIAFVNNQCFDCQVSLKTMFSMCLVISWKIYFLIVMLLFESGVDNPIIKNNHILTMVKKKHQNHFTDSSFANLYFWHFYQNISAKNLRQPKVDLALHARSPF